MEVQISHSQVMKYRSRNAWEITTTATTTIIAITLVTTSTITITATTITATLSAMSSWHANFAANPTTSTYSQTHNPLNTSTRTYIQKENKAEATESSTARQSPAAARTRRG